MDKRRVVITGMGIISPIGLTLSDYWEALKNGTSGADFITHFDTTEFETKFACGVKDFDPTNYIDRKEARRMDRFTHLSLAATKLAVEDSGLNPEQEDLNRIGVILGSGIGGMGTFEKDYKVLFEKGPRRISPFFIPMMIPDIAPGYVSIKYGFKGPNYSTVSACASSSHAMGDALKAIRYSEVDVMVTGGSEAAITKMGVAGFNSMKAISTWNDKPKSASRPFDLNRNGFVIGEGGGTVIMESLDHAQKRGAKIYAEVVGAGFSADAYHITAPTPDGNGAARAMQTAMSDGNIKSEEVDYINAHGTSTPHNDRVETLAIKMAFGDYANQISISSTKSMIGHLLGASGAAELIATILMMNNDTIHPTINLDEADPDCDLNYTPLKAVPKELNVALSNSFGFGGHNVCLAIKKYKQ